MEETDLLSALLKDLIELVKLKSDKAFESTFADRNLRMRGRF